MRKLAVSGAFVFMVMGAMGQQTSQTTVPPTKAWIAKSDGYTHQILDIQLKHNPEGGSAQGLAQFDPLISDPTLADHRAQRRELEVVLAKLKTAESTEKDENVAEDLVILRKALDLQFRLEDYNLEHNVPFINASPVSYTHLMCIRDSRSGTGK